MASPMPVLPLVASMTVCPGLSSPDFSAASITPSAKRSLTEPSGLKASIFTKELTPAGASRCMRTTGVLPTVPRMLSNLLIDRSTVARYYRRESDFGQPTRRDGQRAAAAWHRAASVLHQARAGGPQRARPALFRQCDAGAAHFLRHVLHLGQSVPHAQLRFLIVDMDAGLKRKARNDRRIDIARRSLEPDATGRRLHIGKRPEGRIRV